MPLKIMEQKYGGGGSNCDLAPPPIFNTLRGPCTSNLKRFLQQTASTFATLINSMRVDEIWRSNASESYNFHQLSSSFDRGLTAIKNVFLEVPFKRRYFLPRINGLLYRLFLTGLVGLVSYQIIFPPTSSIHIFSS